MGIIANLPIEIQWNIIKYMRHPVAEVFKKNVFPGVVPRDMNNRGLNREPYKIECKKRKLPTKL